MRQSRCCLLQLHNRTPVKENSNILTKAPRKLKHQKQTKSNIKREEFCMPWWCCFFLPPKKGKKKCQNHFHIPWPTVSNSSFNFCITHGIQESSLKHRNALEKKVFQMQENDVVDKHDHPTWHNSLLKHTCLRQRLNCSDILNSPYLKECEKACNL